MYDWYYCIVIPGLLGGGAGIVSHLITHKKSLEFPQRYKKKWYLGFVADIIIGGSAAVFAVNYIITDNESLRSIVGISILAGIGGESFLLRQILNRYEEREDWRKEVNNQLQLKDLDDVLNIEEQQKNKVNKKKNN